MGHDATTAAGAWKLLVARASLAVVAAAVVTFSPDHSPAFGLGVVAVYAIAAGALTAATARSASRIRSGVRTHLASGGLTALVGILAGVAALAGTGLAALVMAVAALGLIVAVVEFLLSRTPEPGTPTITDHRILGTVAMLLTLGALAGLGNSVVVVGVFGAWAAVSAVFSLITAFTLKWEGDRRPDPMVNP